ncbi:MAG: YbgC/FadM family acyl-CoA thioesterase [Alphaproteobacteria bacterium]
MSDDSNENTGARVAGSGAFDGPTHVLPLRIYYEDTDAAGIVYYANYLKFAERGRTELLRCLGADHRMIMERDGVGFAVLSCHAEYRQPARLDDAIEVRTTLTAVGGATVTMVQSVVRPAAGGAVPLVDIEVRLACIDGRQRAARLPRDVRAALAKRLDVNPAGMNQADGNGTTG